MNNLLNNYASFLVDSHITEHNDSFQEKLDPQTYVNLVKRTGADSVIVPAMCCMGNCYYRTSIGHVHQALQQDASAAHRGTAGR